MNRGGSHSVSGGEPANPEATQWEHLRELLIAPEQRQLTEVLERLDDPVRRAEELSQSLPDAITIAASQDDRMARALQPTIDTALKRSAATNPKAIADAIFPALGPAIRKAISAALMGMIQSLNHLLNQSFSIRGLKWRLEAMRTKKSFAEVVLLHTLVYRVEQIFLIQRHSGILLQHASAGSSDSKDPDLVSGMFTAIQEFVKDAFDTKTGEMLDTLRMDGDHSVWIEQGPQAVLAIVIRGIPPVELRTRFRELLDRIHQLFGPKLAHFKSQISALAMIKPELEDALIFQAREHTLRLSPLLWLLMVFLLAAGGVWSWRAFNAQRQWAALQDRLLHERGIVLTTAWEKSGRYFIAGLRDPLARSVASIVAESRMDPNRIQSQWQPYYALDAVTVLERARRILIPPPTVHLAFASGRLEARGRAPHPWIDLLRARAGAIPGIEALDDSGLEDEQMEALRSAVADLHRQAIYFEPGQWQLDPDQSEALSRVSKIIARIQHLEQTLGLAVRVTIIGRTDPSGHEAYNLQLSQKRAQSVMDYLIQNNIEPSRLQTVGKIAVDSLQKEADENFRSVTFTASIGAE
jgi:outer membrane protein OmpA-like peptidoglycan-associated protein